jgi:alkylation response protein AidB-like acyl-CoA dehydrogenase
VDLELNDDEEALVEGIRSLCEGRFDREQVRGLEGSSAVDRGRWRGLAETGVFGLRLPEADGGAGLGFTEGVLVFQELGRALVPGPLVASHLAAGLVDGAAEGDQVVGLVERGAGPHLVEHLDALDVLLVLDDDGIARVGAEALADLDAAPVPRPLDPLTPLHQLAELPAGEPVADAAVAVEWRRAGAALVAAQLFGTAEAVTTLAVAYAAEREQFDRPIGSFQAVKHLLADMLTRSELARAAVYAAGVTLDGRGVDDPDRTVAAAKITAGSAAVANAKSAIQVHGGMGFTWEIDAHLYLKRALVLDTAFGSADEHCAAVAASL